MYRFHLVSVSRENKKYSSLPLQEVSLHCPGSSAVNFQLAYSKLIILPHGDYISRVNDSTSYFTPIIASHVHAAFRMARSLIVYLSVNRIK